MLLIQPSLEADARGLADDDAEAEAAILTEKAGAAHEQENDERLKKASSQDALRAFTIFRRDARTAGRKPPIIPITTAKMNVLFMTEGERLKPNASSVNVPKFSVE